VADPPAWVVRDEGFGDDTAAWIADSVEFWNEVGGGKPYPTEDHMVMQRFELAVDGYNGKILHVDLTEGSLTEERPGLEFSRRYFGGSAMGTYYCLREIPRDADPLGPENVLTFFPSIVTGAPFPFLARGSFNAKSPVTGGIGDSQMGGYLATELKLAGYDGLVVKGKAKTPVYLWIDNGKAEIRDADSLWGTDIGETEEAIRLELQDPKIRVASIGIGGENLVSYACIINERRHVAGRTGMGAVMGSKNLKAVAVRGNKDSLSLFDPTKLSELKRVEAEHIKNNPQCQSLKEMGTNDGTRPQSEMGALPTRNFNSGVFHEVEGIMPEEMHALFDKKYTCYACPIACKIGLKAQEPYEIDSSYGGPEYETVATLGSYVCNADKYVLAKGHELCNRYTLDTISLGGTIAFAMECFENGLLTLADTDGLELTFGNSKVILPLIEKIAHNEPGIGQLLAKGPREAARIIGNGAERFAMEVKGSPMPAHMPRQKNTQGVIYAVNPFGPDHCSSLPDFVYNQEFPEELRGFMRAMDLNTYGEFFGLSTAKTRMVLYTQMMHGFLDCLGVCIFASYFGASSRIADIIHAVTGWETSNFEFMKVGERKVNMQKFFNYLHGIKTEEDSLPQRLYEPLPEGPLEGCKMDRDEMKQAVEDYYEMAGWNLATGRPTNGKLKELDLEWLIAMEG
jgi:aldehyde:ferredoxin oxidoreductase